MKTSPLIDFHTQLWWWPDHLTDEFVDEGMAAKRGDEPPGLVNPEVLS